MPYVLKAIQHF